MTFSLDEDFAAAAECCRRALDGAPSDPEGWFALLSGVPQDDRAMATLARLKREAGPGLERKAVLHALLAALPRLRPMVADLSAKRLFCTLCAEVANPTPAREKMFELAGAPFAEMAQLATLRRLPAGDLVFDVGALPHSWLLKFHPRDLPAALREITTGLGGFGPLVSPHLNAWRANPLLLLRSEYERSLALIARTVDLRPDIRGLMADAWFYAAEVGELFPHLAWVRRFFLDNGAFFIEMEAAPPESGFMVGSARRRQLYKDGSFRPRRTLVLWRRADLLAWASPTPTRRSTGTAPKIRPAPPPSRLRRIGTALLNRHPRLYGAALLAGAAAMAAAAGAAAPWAAVPAFAAALALLWAVQYAYFQ